MNPVKSLTIIEAALRNRMRIGRTPNVLGGVTTGSSLSTFDEPESGINVLGVPTAGGARQSRFRTITQRMGTVGQMLACDSFADQPERAPRKSGTGEVTPEGHL